MNPANNGNWRQHNSILAILWHAKMAANNSSTGCKGCAQRKSGPEGRANSIDRGA